MIFGLVLGAGGTLGEAYHRGVVRAMHERGLDPRQARVVVGTSAGSIVATSIRRQHVETPVPELVEHAARRRLLPDRAVALGLARRPRQLLNALLLAPELARGRIPLTMIVDGLRTRHGSSWPEAALWVVAVRRDNGERVVFGRTGAPPADVGSAVAASCAIPGYFTPVEIGGVAYVDGGVHSPTNADVLAPVELDLVVISSPLSIDPRAVRPRWDLPLRLVFSRYLREEVWSLRRSGDSVVTIEPDARVLELMGINMMDGRNADEVEERAYELALRRLPA